MKAIPAVYHNGAFHPLGPVDLPDATNVEVLLPSNSSDSLDVAALRRTAGVWAELPGVDDALAAIEQLRTNAALRDDAN